MNLDLLVQRAIAILQANVPADGSPYELGYSGGKDSDAILSLAKKAGVPFVARHSLTTIDAPEVVRHVMAQGVEIVRPLSGNLFHRVAQRDFRRPGRAGAAASTRSASAKQAS